MCCFHLLSLAKRAEQLSLGIFHPAFAPIEHVKQELQRILPDDIHILASQRLGISLTRWPDGHNLIVTDFASRDEVIQVSRWWGPGPGGRWLGPTSCQRDFWALPRGRRSCSVGAGWWTGSPFVYT